MMLDLTVAICMYNAEAYIEKTLQSVLSQTFQQFHLLIIDDKSTDGSIAKVRRFLGDADYAYELIEFKENHGICFARNYAERHTTTRYIMFLDADDMLYPDAIEKMFGKIISDPDLMAVGCYMEWIDNDGKKIGGGIYLGTKTKEEFFEKASHNKLIFMQATAIYDREIAISVGGYDIDSFPKDSSIRYQDYCEDLDLWTRMSDLYVKGKAIIVLPEVLYKYRKAGGLSSNSYNMILKMRYVKKNLLRRRNGERNHTFEEFMNSLTDEEKNNIRRDAIAADSLRNGVFYLREHRLLKGIRELFRSIQARPFYIIDKIRHNILKR
jgi:glycosyltransferase involved in cell wall biosynthesis